MDSFTKWRHILPELNSFILIRKNPWNKFTELFFTPNNLGDYKNGKVLGKTHMMWADVLMIQWKEQNKLKYKAGHVMSGL